MTTASKATDLRISAFPGAPNLPTFAGLEKGFFAEEGVAVDLSLTTSSLAQAEAAAAGEFDIVFTAFDNVVAYAEGQGAAPGVDPDYVVLMGATQLELAIIAAPDVSSCAALGGRSIALDALTTGFAFVLFDMLERNGVAKDDVTYAAVGATPQRWRSVREGEHAATLTIEPFTSIAKRSGFNVLDLSTRHYESYQGGVITARRAFARDEPEAVRAFIRAYLRGLAWVLDPANAAEAAGLLKARMPEIPPAAIESVMASLRSPRSGLTPDAAILPDGMKRVLALRSRYGSGGDLGDDYRKYLDLSHIRAVRGANQVSA
ncbi:ABC transporter substrate-binding protein [Marinivivus vitaminiproducens]|uniref:ABC transporter substrate-binding protein n=1 Tax=Marinivivus vitaminiproducens TaxID=3035935 RepID=UPI0027A5042A|nr:ABC transporter substrate-binding protein [Geminicoccaceae bacterium SCSIO 64248]